MKDKNIKHPGVSKNILDEYTEKALIRTEMDNGYLKQSSPYINQANPNQTNMDENTYELQEIIQEKCELANSDDVQEMVITENIFFINSDDSIYQETKAICESMPNIDVQALEVSFDQELIEGDNPVYHKKNQKRLASKGIGIGLPIAKQTKISDAQVINILGDESILKEDNSNSKGSSFINYMIDNQHLSINEDVQPYSLEKIANYQIAQIKIENNSSIVKLKDGGDEGQPMCQNLQINVDNNVYKNMYQNKKIQSNETNLVVKDFINSKNEQVINLNIFLSSSKQPNEREQNGTEKQLIIETFQANSDNCRHIQSKLGNTAESLFGGKSNFVCKCICALQPVKEQQLNSEVIHYSNINNEKNKEDAYTGSISTLNTKNVATYCDAELHKNSKQKKLIISPNISQSTQTHDNIYSMNEIIKKSDSNSNEHVCENNETEKLNKIFKQTDVNLKSNKEMINRPNNTIVIPNSNETTTNNIRLKSSNQKFHQPTTTNTEQIFNSIASATVIEFSYSQADGDTSNRTNVDIEPATAYDVKGVENDRTDEVCTFPNNILPKSLISLEHLNRSSPALSEKNKEYKFYIMPIKEKVTESRVLENLFSPNPSTPIDVNIEGCDFKYIKKIYFDQPFIDKTNNIDVEKNDNQLPRLDDKQPSHLHQNNIQNENLLSVVCHEHKNVRETENLKYKNQEMIDLQLARQLHTELNRQEFKRSSLKK